jgi:hypothetical protein
VPEPSLAATLRAAMVKQLVASATGQGGDPAGVFEAQLIATIAAREAAAAAAQAAAGGYDGE